MANGNSDLRPEWLRSLLAVAESGGYSRAARALHRSQPAVSTHLKELERALDLRLVEKIGGKVRLTPSGETVASEAKEILEGLRRIRESAARSKNEVEGVFRVGASTTPGNYVLPPLLGTFERLHPRVRTTLVVGNSSTVLARLLKNDVDLAAVGMRPTASDFVTEPFGEDEIVVFAHASHPLARAKGAVSPADCARYRFLIRESDSATRQLSEGWFTKNRIRPAVLELGCPETLKRSVAAGLGLGILSKLAVTAPGGERDFRVLRVPGFPIRRRLYLTWLKRKRLTRTISSFLELARSERGRA